MKKKLISSKNPWEEKIGYSRAVIIGDEMEIAGTAAVKDEAVFAPHDGYEQTKFILEELKKLIEEHGFSMEDTVRSRMYVTDISQWEEVSRAFHQVFEHIRPCATMVEVSKLIHQEVVVEIELSLKKA
jgi:enamine deaminase RidA (YjgF/YER057c/UK114 family)